MYMNRKLHEKHNQGLRGPRPICMTSGQGKEQVIVDELMMNPAVVLEQRP